MSRLPILALPFLADGAFFLAAKIGGRLLDQDSVDVEVQEGEPGS